MDSSTLCFLLLALLGFVYVKRQNSINRKIHENPSKLDAGKESSTETSDDLDDETMDQSMDGTGEDDPILNAVRTAKRNVTPDMIEIVQTMAPSLHVDQIRYSLEKTGTIEGTIEAYLAGQKLPFPPEKHTEKSEIVNEQKTEQNEDYSISDEEDIELEE